MLAEAALEFDRGCVRGKKGAVMEDDEGPVQKLIGGAGVLKRLMGPCIRGGVLLAFTS